MSERWERLAVLSWDRQGMPQTVRALTGGMALRDGEAEYVRADLHAGAVKRGDAAVKLLREIRNGKHSLPGTIVAIDRFLIDLGEHPAQGG
jgi:hypothetical protein